MKSVANRRKKVFANKMHKVIFMLVLVAAFLPMIFMTVVLYFLIFNITAEQIGMPEMIAYHVLPAAKKVMSILLLTAPVVAAVILYFVHKITHQIIGPFDRIVRELNERVIDTKKGHIIIRNTDKFWPLVEKINKLIDKLERK